MEPKNISNPKGQTKSANTGNTGPTKAEFNVCILSHKQHLFMPAVGPYLLKLLYERCMHNEMRTNMA